MLLGAGLTLLGMNRIRAARCTSSAKQASAVLYGNLACPYAHRAAFALNLCDFRCTLQTVPTTNQFGVIDVLGVEAGDVLGSYEGRTAEELHQYKEEYKRTVNTSGEVPSLQLPCGAVVVESEIVSEYMDAATKRELVPSDPATAARVRLAMKRFNDVPVAIVRLLKNQLPEQDEALVARLDVVLAKFLSALDQSSAFCIGDSVTLADVHAAPFIYRFGIVLRHYRGYDMVERFPRLEALLNAVAELPAWRASLQPTDAKLPVTPERLIEMYALYSHNGVWVDGKLGGRGVSSL